MRWLHPPVSPVASPFLHRAIRTHLGRGPADGSNGSEHQLHRATKTDGHEFQQRSSRLELARGRYSWNFGGSVVQNPRGPQQGRFNTSNLVVLSLKNTDVVGDLPVHNCQHRSDSLYLHLGHREVVAIEDSQISQLPGLDRADLVFHAEEPAIAPREHAERFLASGVLLTVH